MGSSSIGSLSLLDNLCQMLYHSTTVTAGTGGTLDSLLASVCLGQAVTRPVVMR
jgi:hypothetical protein